MKLINPNIEILTKYQGQKSSIKCRCKIDNYEWTTNPYNLLNGSKCHKCMTNNFRRTHDEFINLLYQKNPNIIVLSEYKNCKTKVKCKCLIDNYEWESTPDNLLRTKGCPKCAGNIKRTHEEFINEIAILHPNIEILEKYINMATLIKCKYKNDDLIFYSTPNNLYKKNIFNKEQRFSRTLSRDEFINKVHNVNPNIIILGEYKNNYTKIKCKCLIDGCEWTVKPYFLLNGESICPVCNGRRLTPELFKERFYNIHKNIELLSDYISSNVKIKCKCLIDNHIWCVNPSSLLLGKGCSKCRDRNKTKTNEQFLEELSEANQYVIPLEVYEKIDKKIKFQCKICGNIWETTPSHVLRGSGCPECKLSKGEKKINKYFNELNIMYISQFKFDDLVGVSGNKLSYDFYLPIHNLLIEYQGQFHDGSVPEEIQSKYDLKKQQEHDRRKREYAKQHNIELLEIWYWNFNKIEEILNQELNKYNIIH